jgi:hypothetical protein
MEPDVTLATMMLFASNDFCTTSYQYTYSYMKQNSWDADVDKIHTIYYGTLKVHCSVAVLAR